MSQHPTRYLLAVALCFGGLLFVTTPRCHALSTTTLIDVSAFIFQTNILNVIGDVEIESGAELNLLPSYGQPSPLKFGPGVVSIRALTHTGTRTGEFSNVGEHLRDGLFVDAITYNSNDVTVAILQAAPGDIDGDHDVDSTDIQLILGANSFNNTAGGPYTWREGDNNGDGLVDSIDIQNILATNLFGQLPYAALAASAAAVPEPSSLALALMAVVGLLLRRGRRR